MYYSIENRTDKEVGNIFPQANCLTQSSAHLLTTNEFYTNFPKLVFELEKKSKLTDLISQASISSIGLLVSAKLKEILIKHKLPKYKLYQSELKISNLSIDYFWVHFNFENFINFIDFENSIFYYTKFEMQVEQISIKDFNEYKMLKKENGIMWDVEIESIKLKDNLIDDFDLFNFYPFTRNIFISEKLKNDIVQNSISGIEIKESNIIC
jgi:hypothetical protein